MAGKQNKKLRKLAKLFFKQPRAKRQAGREIVEQSAALMGLSLAEFHVAFEADDPETRFAIRTVASRNDDWIEHFGTGGEGPRDWEGFFTGLMECISTFIGLIGGL